MRSNSARAAGTEFEQLDRRAPRQLEQHAVGPRARGAGPPPAGDQTRLAEELALAAVRPAQRRAGWRSSASSNSTSPETMQNSVLP